MKKMLPYIFLLLIGLGCQGERDTSSPADFQLNINADHSISFLRELVDDHSGNPENYIRLANYYFENNEPEKAQEVLDRALERLPANDEIKLLAVKANVLTGNQQEASDLFRNVIVQEENLLNYEVAAEYWFKEGEYAKSLDNVNRAINLDQGNSAFFDLKARNLLHLNDTSGAVDSYFLALEKGNTSYFTYIDFLKLLITLEDSELFEKIFLDLSTGYEKRSETHIVLANYMAETGDYDSAKACLFRITDNNFLTEKIKGLSTVNFLERNYDSAIYYLQDFDLISPELLLIRARAYDRLWKYQQSEESYLNILEIDSTHTIAVNELQKLRRKVRYLRDVKRREETRKQIIPSQPISPIK